MVNTVFAVRIADEEQYKHAQKKRWKDRRAKKIRNASVLAHIIYSENKTK